NEGELQELGEVSALLQDVNRIEVQASDVKLTEELKQDLLEVIRRHGGKLESYGHPTTTLEELFLRIVEESKAHPGRRFLPGADRAAPPAPPAPPKADGQETAIREQGTAVRE